MTGHSPITRVVIVGGGTAGWIAAAVLSKLLGRVLDITLVESDAIGTVGVGEATIPQIRRLNGILGIDEAEFVRETKGSFKLGIEFNNWGRRGESYLHTFGDTGLPLAGLPFHHYWLRHRASHQGSDFWDYSLHHKAAYANRFAPLERVGKTAMTGLAYAYHFDAGLYARYLRKLSEARGVTRVEGIVEDVALDAESGHIESVRLAGGRTVAGELFIDCTGFRGLLIGQALGVPYQDWSHWLHCNRAVAVPCERVGKLLPYTKATAHDAGWQWRIPLQHRTGNGHVFSDAFTTVDDATQVLLDNLDGAPTAEPKVLGFTTGRRERLWEKNCVSLGLASGFLEPLESTSIHIIQSNVGRLVDLFPDASLDPVTIAEYNRVTTTEYDLIRDFLILHYKQTQRDDTPFWRHCRDMEVPDSLTHKIALFARNGHLYRDADDLFREASWIQVMLGQNVEPRGWHRQADSLTDAQLSQFMGDVQTLVGNAVAPLPDHGDFVARHAASA